MGQNFPKAQVSGFDEIPYGEDSNRADKGSRKTSSIVFAAVGEYICAVQMTRSIRKLEASKRCSVLSGLLLLSLLLSIVTAACQPPAVRATIDVSRTRAPISPYLYGMFLEHG